MKRRFFVKLLGAFSAVPLAVKAQINNLPNAIPNTIEPIANSEKADKLIFVDKSYLMPKGNYIAKIVKAEIKDNMMKDGKRLKLQFKILNGKYKGFVIFTGVNIVNQNAIAVEIAMEKLTSICEACNKIEITDAEEILEIPLIIKVSVQESIGSFPPQNTIIKYSKLSNIAHL